MPHQTTKAAFQNDLTNKISGGILFFYTVQERDMRLQVVLMRRHGKALEQHQIRSSEVTIGNVVVAHMKVEALGRYSDVASMEGNAGQQNGGFPPLYDVRLAHMGAQGFVLSGIQLEGTIGFAQAWWCREV